MTASDRSDQHLLVVDDTAPAAGPSPVGMEAPGGRKGARATAEQSRQNILAVATEEFARNGLAGARVDSIAERTLTSKRAMYYHFGSKEGLYLAVLEKAYGAIREIEEKLNLETYDPEIAIRILVGATFDYQDQHPEFVRLVGNENIHHASHMAKSKVIDTVNAPIIETIEGILKRGYTSGVFSVVIDPVDLHMMISAVCHFRVSNRYTFGTIFKRDLNEFGTRARHRQLMQDFIVSFLKHG